MTMLISSRTARIVALVCSVTVALIIVSCGSTTPTRASGGSLDLNQHLRADLKASNGLDGRFFSDGQCLDSNAMEECHLISALRNSEIASIQLGHLRRSEIFWMESDGFPVFSYEVTAKNFDVLNTDNPPKVLVSQATVGSCVSFPFVDPETRNEVPGLPPFDETNSQQVAQQFDVTIHQCAKPIVGANPEDMSPVNNNCSDLSVQHILSSTQQPSMPTPPLCVLNMGVNAPMMADLSYSLTPGFASSLSAQAIQAFWPGLMISQLSVAPNLKVVPVNGTRTISRKMEFAGMDPPNPDQSQVLHWNWTVPVSTETGHWIENFSPNIVVVKARLRKGSWSASGNTYLPMTRLDIGDFRCGDAAGPAVTEFSLQMCETNMKGGLRVTPTYDFGTFTQARVDDGVRLLWKAQVLLPPGSTLVSSSDPVSLELDLTALSAVGTSGAGLMANPPAHDFGLVRTHLSPTSLPAFTVQSIGTLPAQIQSAELIGRDTAEFGAVQIHPFLLRSPVVGRPLPTWTPPFFLQAGSSMEIDLTPSFQTAGMKQAQLRITFEDVQQSPHTLILPVTATAVTPLVNIEPQQLIFLIPQNSAVPSLDRAMFMSNDGGSTFTRQSLSISGPESGDFRIDGSEYGLTQSNLSQPLTLNPGDSETYRLGFYPNAPGDRRATLTISTSEGAFAVPLSGHCDGACRQPQPAPTYRLPPPPEHPVLPELKRGYTLKSY